VFPESAGRLSPVEESLTFLELLSIKIHLQPSFAHYDHDVLPDIGLKDVGEVVLTRAYDDSQALVRPAVDQEPVSLADGQIVEDAARYLDGLEKVNPELEFDLDRLYKLLRIEKKAMNPGISLNPGKLFEPIIWFFALIFKIFVRLVSLLISGGGSEPTDRGKKQKAAAK